jgi:hypothetical protein
MLKLLREGEFKGITRTITVQGLIRVSGRDDTFIYSLLSSGEIVSLIVGDRRRHIKVDSWEAYLRRCETGEQLDPEERAANIAAYRATLDRKGARQMAAARQVLLDKHAAEGKAPNGARKRPKRPRLALQRGHALSEA